MMNCELIELHCFTVVQSEQGSFFFETLIVTCPQQVCAWGN